jgi:hypothetical protein
MKLKLRNTGFILSIIFLVIVLGFLVVNRLNRSHLDHDQAQYYVEQLSKIKNDTIPIDTLINRQTAIKIAGIIFSNRIGRLKTVLLKPFDVYLINGYWFIYGPHSKYMLDYGPMIIINCHTGEIRIK